jgi:hypothetical protein
MSPNEIRQKALELRLRAQRGNLGMLLPVCFVAYVGWRALTIPSTAEHIAGGIALVAALYAAFGVYKRRLFPRRATFDDAALFRGFLQRRRDALRKIWYWYAAPVLVGLVTFAVTLLLVHPQQQLPWKNIAPFVLWSFIWALSLSVISWREAQRLQAEIDALGR